MVRDISDRKKIALELLRDEARLEALLKLAQMVNSDTKAVSDFVLEQAINMTSSLIGFLALVDDDQQKITLYSWSPREMNNSYADDAPTVLLVEQTGLLGEVIRQRKPILTNDYPW